MRAFLAALGPFNIHSFVYAGVPRVELLELLVEYAVVLSSDFRYDFVRLHFTIVLSYFSLRCSVFVFLGTTLLACLQT